MGISKNVSRLLTTIFYLYLFKSVGGEDMSDQDFLDNYDTAIKEVACAAVAAQATDMKVNLGRYSTREELAKMAFWNIGKDFTKNKLTFGNDIKWKRDLVDIIFEIFQVSCPNSSVPHAYMNIFREFTMIYLNSVEPKTSNNTQAWQTMQNMFYNCKVHHQIYVPPYDFVSKALKVTGIRGKVQNMVETTELFPPEEKIDAVFSELDQVVENFWWVFSHAFGRCYKQMTRPAETAPKLKALFVHDILKPLLNRWGDPGPLQDFGPIVGGFDVNRIQRNIRFCVTAAYFLNGITELQMVRPLRVGYVQEGRNSILNRKTGASIS